MNLKKENKWNQKTFNNMYVPQFIYELKNDPNAQKYLNALMQENQNDKIITLVCFCPNEQLCHRSIIAGILQGAGYTVDCKTDYSKYYDIYTKMSIIPPLNTLRGV